MKTVFVFVLSLALCYASASTEEQRLRDLVKSLQEENARQAAIIKEFQSSSSRRLEEKKTGKTCFDFKYTGGCTAGSSTFCSKLKAMTSVDGHAVRGRHQSGGNCGLSFDSKNWGNLDEKTTFASKLCSKIQGCTHFGINDDAKNKPGGLVSGTFGYIEFSDGGQACNDKKHNNNAYKTYAMKDCPAPPPPKYDPKMPKSSPPIDANDFQGVKVKSDDGIVALGKKGDVSLLRTGDNKAALYGSVSLVDNLIAEKAITAKGQVTTFATLQAKAGVQLGMNAGSCDKSRAGTIRYNTETDTMEFCSGAKAAWTSFASGKPSKDGKAADTAGNSCRSILADYPTSPSGKYWVKPDRWGGDAFIVYCDMKSAPGGWTLVSQGFGNNMPTTKWRGNGPYQEKSCEQLQDHTTKTGLTCKLEASKINALVSNDNTGRYKSFTPYPHYGGSNRNIYSLGTCKYDYTKPLNFNTGTNKDNNPCMWSSDKFDMSNPQMQPHRGTQAFEHYKYKGQNGRGFCIHYGTDKVRWWLVDGHHHGDTREKKINFILWVY